MKLQADLFLIVFLHGGGGCLLNESTKSGKYTKLNYVLGLLILEKGEIIFTVSTMPPKVRLL